MLKLLFIRATFPKLSETFFINEVIEVMERGHDVRILALNGEYDVLHESYLNSEISNKVIYAENSKAFESALAGSGYVPDLVVCPFGSNLIVKRSYKIAKEYNIPYVVILRARDIYTDLSCTESTLLMEKAQQTLNFIKNANAIVTISDENILYLKKVLAISQDIHLYRLGVDVNKFYFRKAVNASSIKRILYVGRFIPKKGIEYLLKSMVGLKDNKIKFELHLFGEGPLKDLYEQLIKDFDLGAYAFIHGEISQEEVVKEFHQSDVFVIPSIVDDNNDRDVEATVIKEAMACGIPVITTDIPGNSSFITNNVDGYIIPQKDSESLTSTILHVSNSDMTSLVRNAREKVCELYDLKKSCSDLNDLFEKVVRDFRRAS